jgi:hypothetical protein
MRLAHWCRTVAVLIAILGAIDPSIMLARSSRPIVSLLDASSPTTPIETDTSDPAAALAASELTALTERVARQLSRSADVERGLTAGASAVVVTGDRLPTFADSVMEPSFVVLPAGPAAEAVEIDELAGPTRAHVDTRVPFIAVIRVIGGRGGTLAVTLSAGGATLDRAERVVAEEDARFEVPLTFVPTSIGTARIHVVAALSRSGPAPTRPAISAGADTLTRVDHRPWSVFVFDRRPSWMSTFVRRALEDDERFAVTSRTVTSRGVATDTPNAPADLHDVAALSSFDAIIVGAPDAMTTDDVAGLDAFMRRRGGAVICLWDVRPTGPALAMMGVDRWNADTRSTDSAVTLPGGAIRASDLAWPARLPARSGVIGPLDETGPTTWIGSPGSPAPDRPAIVWSMPVGPGQLVVSGALDSWRYRGAPHATFDAAWRELVASAAEGSPAPLDVSVTPSVARPGRPIAIEVRLRDGDAAVAAGIATQTTMALRLEGPNGGSSAATIRVWPGASPDRFVATFTAPEGAGWYHLVASDGPVAGDADLLVDAGASSPRAGERDALAAWATSRGGRVIDATELGELDSAIQRLTPAGSTREPYHPMRSAWWIGPMTLLLSIDWLRRRRHGRS